MRPIPADDILDVYVEQSRRTRQAVTHIVTAADRFIAVSDAGTTPDGLCTVNVDWCVSPNFSLTLLAAAAETGRAKYGDSWLGALIKNLTRQANQR